MGQLGKKCGVAQACFKPALQFRPRAARVSTVGGAVFALASTSSAGADAAGADAA